MLNHFRGTLYWRTLAFVSVVMLAGALFLAALAYYYARLAAEEAYDRLQAGAAIQVATNLYVQGGVLALSPPVAAFATLSNDDLIYYKVTDPRGVVVAGSKALLASDDAEKSRLGPVFRDGHFQKHDVRLASISRYMPNATVPGWAVVTVAQTTHARDELATAMTVKIIMLIAMLSVLGIGASAFAIQRGLLPLVKIERLIAEREPSDLKPLAVETPREMQAIIAAINVLMTRLSKRMVVMQRFIADAAHQIRTPLAQLDAQIELLTDEDDPVARRRRLAELRASSSAAARLTSQLLNHAMVTHRAEGFTLHPIELTSLARGMLGRTIPLASREGQDDISVAFQGPHHPVYISGDIVSLQEALSNILHNALLHGHADVIDVTLTETHHTVEVAVSDNGPGIAPEHWSRVALPFVSLHPERGGSGLGLAIVQEVMRAHGGELAFRFTGDRRFTVVMVFPRNDPPNALAVTGMD